MLMYQQSMSLYRILLSVFPGEICRWKRPQACSERQLLLSVFVDISNSNCLKYTHCLLVNSFSKIYGLECKDEQSRHNLCSQNTEDPMHLALCTPNTALSTHSKFKSTPNPGIFVYSERKENFFMKITWNVIYLLVLEFLSYAIKMF